MAESSGENLLERLRKLDSCALSDACDRLGFPAGISGIEARTVQVLIASRVRTVRLAAADPGVRSTRHLCTGAIEAADAGDIIVVEQRTGIDAAGWGGILSRAAQLRKIAGVIVEGPARDIDEAGRIGFPVYSRMVTPRTARGRVYEIATDEPVEVGGVSVSSGDYVLADGSGIVFLASSNAAVIIGAAEEISARERAMANALAQGGKVSEVMGASYEDMLKR